MPGFAHIVVSLLFSAFLIKFSQNKFTYRHAIIFTVNSHFGPDAFGWLPWVGPGSEIYYFIHGYGWIVMAFLMALPWFYVNNHSLHWKPKFHLTKKSKSDPNYLKYMNIYCLVAAGGIFHQFLDLIGHPPTIHYEEVGNIVDWGGVWFGNDNWFNLDWVLSTGAFPCGNTFGFTLSNVFTTVTAIILVLVVFFRVPKEQGKDFTKFAVILTLIYFLPLLIAYFIPDPHNFIENNPIAYENYTGEGSYYPSTFYLTGGESDFGVILYMLLFFFVPMLFLYWGTFGLPFGKDEKQEGTIKNEAKKDLNEGEKADSNKRVEITENSLGNSEIEEPNIENEE